MIAGCVRTGYADGTYPDAAVDPAMKFAPSGLWISDSRPLVTYFYLPQPNDPFFFFFANRKSIGTLLYTRVEPFVRK